MTAEQMWKNYTADHPTNETYQAWAFCGGGELGDELARLVLDGVKTATAGPLIAYRTAGEDPPKAGDLSIVLFGSGEAACIIRDTRVRLVPFCEVDARHAYLEDEGNRSLAFWRQVHREAFTPDYEEAGLPFDENGLCVLEEFEVVYR